DRHWLHRTALALPVGLLAACGEEVRDSTTRGVTPQADAIDGLFRFSVTLGAVIWLLVMGLLAVPIWRSWRRRGGDAEVAPTDRGPVRLDAPASEVDGAIAVADPTHVAQAEADHRVRNRLIWVGGIILPALVLVTLLVYSSVVGRAAAHVPEDGELVVDVIGHMFWWEVIYEDEAVITANEIVVPVDRPVRFNLTTEDVIHSFWIPRIHGKVDMIPGRTNTFTFTATETGDFRGNCAEFCGIAHAQMVAFVRVVEQDEFDAWVAAQQQPATTGASTDGEQVFIEAGCAACHAVAGTDAVARVGPDLTHLASRRTLAAGIVPNERERLEQLIIEPQAVKPGIPMPAAQLSADELEALLDYLEGLE
ncbi:MAG: cytochrome c oxidase subunit II, partial [Nitriliruptor sp.]